MLCYCSQIAVYYPSEIDNPDADLTRVFFTFQFFVVRFSIGWTSVTEKVLRGGRRVVILAM